MNKPSCRIVTKYRDGCPVEFLNEKLKEIDRNFATLSNLGKKLEDYLGIKYVPDDGHYEKEKK